MVPIQTNSKYKRGYFVHQTNKQKHASADIFHLLLLLMIIIRWCTVIWCIGFDHSHHRLSVRRSSPRATKASYIPMCACFMGNTIRRPPYASVLLFQFVSVVLQANHEICARTLSLRVGGDSLERIKRKTKHCYYLESIMCNASPLSCCILALSCLGKYNKFKQATSILRSRPHL